MEEVVRGVLAPVGLAEMLRELGMPEVHEEHAPGGVPVVVDAVLEGVVEDDGIAFDPLAAVGPAADRDVPRWHDDAKVAREPRVRGPAVGAEHGARGERREERLAAAAWVERAGVSLASKRSRASRDSASPRRRPCRKRCSLVETRATSVSSVRNGRASNDRINATPAATERAAGRFVDAVDDGCGLGEESRGLIVAIPAGVEDVLLPGPGDRERTVVSEASARADLVAGIGRDGDRVHEFPPDAEVFVADRVEVVLEERREPILGLRGARSPQNGSRRCSKASEPLESLRGVLEYS